MGGFCSSPPRQPQLLPLLGRGTLIIIIIIIIIITHNITSPCLHPSFFCNFNENFKIRAGFHCSVSSAHPPSPSHTHPPLHATQGNLVPVFLRERLSGGAVCSRNVDYETFRAPLTVGRLCSRAERRDALCCQTLPCANAMTAPRLCWAKNKPFPGALLAVCAGNEISGYLNTLRKKNLVYFISSRTSLLAFQSLIVKLGQQEPWCWARTQAACSEPLVTLGLVQELIPTLYMGTAGQFIFLNIIFYFSEAKMNLGVRPRLLPNCRIFPD